MWEGIRTKDHAMSKQLRFAGHWVLSIITAASFSLCVAASALWIRTHFVGDGYVGVHDIRTRHTQYSLFCIFEMPVGEVQADVSIWPPLRPLPPRPANSAVNSVECVFQIHNKWEHGEPFRLDGRGNGWHGFALDASLNEPGRTEATVLLPWWVITTFFVLLPAIQIMRCWRGRGVVPGTCVACGYNLTGNASGVCPECGTLVPATSEAIT